MVQYTDEFLATARQRYVETKIPLRLVAAELGINDRDLHRMAMDHGWPRRSERARPADRGAVAGGSEGAGGFFFTFPRKGEVDPRSESGRGQ
jgi:hypothetical protein